MFCFNPSVFFTHFKGINFCGLDHIRESLCLSKSHISKRWMFWDRLSIQTKWVVFFYQMSVGIDSDLNENEKDPYQQSVQENEMGICKEILKDVDNIINFLIYLSLIFQLTHHILISIPLPSTNLFFQLTYQFNRISIPIQSTNLFF